MPFAQWQAILIQQDLPSKKTVVAVKRYFQQAVYRNGKERGGTCK